MISRHHLHLRALPLLALIVLFSLILVSLASCGSGQTSTPTPATPSLTYTSSFSPTDAPTQTPYIITAVSQVTSSVTATPALFFLSLANSPHHHLFAYSPTGLSLTRLTYGAWDDVSPALSPDGTRLVFASNRNGYWNFYILDLRTGETQTLTNSPEYKGNPSWSQPDGAFIAYESLVNGNLEILVRSTTDLNWRPLPVTSGSWRPTSFRPGPPAWPPDRLCLQPQRRPRDLAGKPGCRWRFHQHQPRTPLESNPTRPGLQMGTSSPGPPQTSPAG